MQGSSTTQDNMSTEQILSSIRNILSDGTEGGEPQAFEPKIEKNSDDDIFNLTSAMIVKKVLKPAKPNIKIEMSDKDIDSLLDDEVSEYAEEYSLKPEDSVSENVEDEKIIQSEEDDDIFDLSPTMILKNSQTQEKAEKEEISIESFEKEIEKKNLEKIVEKQISEKAEEKTINSKEQKFEKNLGKENNHEMTSSVANSLALENVANDIIASFSKLFQNYTPKMPESRGVVSQEKPKNIYDNNELKSEVQKTVENWILKNIDSDMKIKDVVRDEIAMQTRVWLDENLQNLIYSTVSQELERVMVKVGKSH